MELAKAKEIVAQLQGKLDKDRAALTEVWQKTEELKQRREDVEIEREMLKFKMLEYEETLNLAIEVLYLEHDCLLIFSWIDTKFAEGVITLRLESSYS